MFQVYIDDALGERVWVDRADCRGFVDNIVTAFNTNLPKGGLASMDIKTDASSGLVILFAFCLVSHVLFPRKTMGIVVAWFRQTSICC